MIKYKLIVLINIGVSQMENKHHTLDDIKNGKIPRHIAVIMDGNGRWATAQGLVRLAGHTAGVEAIDEVLETVKKIGTKYFTVYAFSTENWRRPEDEVNGLMNLLVEYLDKKIAKLHAEGVCVRTIGDPERLSPRVRQKIENAYALTKDNDAVIFNIALNYGGRQEIVHACREIAKACEEGTMSWEDIDEARFADHLYTAGQPDPDLLIRSSGELRLSNFLLWQVAYSEFWITDTYWPDFRAGDLYDAVYAYQKRDRRYGGLKK